MAKRKRIDLSKIPQVQEEIVAIISRELYALEKKPSLSIQEGELMVKYANLLATVYKDYRAEAVQIEKDLKQKTKADIQRIIELEAKKAN